MQTIVVNRSGDVAEGNFRTNDNAVTLREAISIAAESDQKTLITFADSVKTVTLNSGGTNENGDTIFNGFTIPDGANITIDGGNDVVIDGGDATAHFVVADGGVLVLRDIALENGRNETDSNLGRAATGEQNLFSVASSENQGDDGVNGQDAFGSILNEGALILDNVRFDGNTAIAQTGQAGGNGGNGRTFNTLTKANDGFIAEDGNDGVDGTDSGAGGDGGDGGDAGSVINRGTLTVLGVLIGGENAAMGGDGGQGGTPGVAGDGATGEDGGEGTAVVGFSGDGGDGGDGGDVGKRGDGGDGGDASVGIVNQGVLNLRGEILVSASANDDSDGGSRGFDGFFRSGGDGGAPGQGGTGGANGADGSFGNDGAASPVGDNGDNGGESAAFFNSGKLNDAQPTDGADNFVGSDDADAIKGLRGADTLIGRRGDDTLEGGLGADRLVGGLGSDSLEGGLGRDVINGLGGKDTLDGGGGRDNLNGGGGRDLLIGGKGGDILKGGGGRDVFQFKNGAGRDTITDFRQRADKIEITNGADGFEDLTITQVGDDVMIRFANVRIKVEDDNESAFNASDFIFS